MAPKDRCWVRFVCVCLLYLIVWSSGISVRVRKVDSNLPKKQHGANVDSSFRILKAQKKEQRRKKEAVTVAAFNAVRSKEDRTNTNNPLPSSTHQRIVQTTQQQQQNQQKQPNQAQEKANNLTSTPKQGRIANFLLAGTQKGGTTALAMYLMNQIPKAWLCHPHPQHLLQYTIKESHFFDWDHLYQQGLPMYQRLFRKCSNERIWMDATPADMLYPERVHQIYQQHGTAESVKILFLLREPASRELSWYRHLYREHAGKCKTTTARGTTTTTNNNNNTLIQSDTLCQSDGTLQSFENRMETLVLPSITNHSQDDTYRYHQRGYYAKWLQRWFALFDRRQIWVANYNSETKNQTDFIRRVHVFLNLPPPSMPKQGTFQLPKANHKHAKQEVLPSCELQQTYFDRYEQYHNPALYRLLRDTQHRAPDVEQRPFPPFEFKCTS